MDRSLYDEDFFLWSRQQAEALRAEAARGGSNTLDWDLLAEEVENLGGSQLRECLSRTATIIEHLAKLAWSGRVEPRAGWRNTVRTQRRELRFALTPSIRAQVEEALERLHLDAFEVAAESLADHGDAVAVDQAVRWSFAQVLGERDDPLG